MYAAMLRCLSVTVGAQTILPGIIKTVLIAILPCLFIVLALLLIHVFLAIMMAKVAKMKGHPPTLALILCLMLGFIGYAYVVCLPDAKTRQLQNIKSAILTDPDFPDEMPNQTTSDK